jgi:hypothetical protein
MIRDNKIFFLAFLIFILPLLGLPLWWRFFFIMVFSIVLMISALDWQKIRSAKPFSRDLSIETPVEHHEPALTSITEVLHTPQVKKVPHPRKKKQITEVMSKESDHDISF